MSCGVIVLVFALLYFFIPGTLGRTGIWASLYFSIATFASGGTSIVATSIVGEVLAAFETILGYLMTGLLVAILVKNTIGN